MHHARHPQPSTIERHTAAWKFQVWAGFALSVAALAVGIWHLPVDPWIKGYFGMGLVFLTNACFALSKTIRDDHEADKLISRIDEAKTEKLIRDFEVAS